MPQHKGNVVAKSEYGIKFSEDGPWFNWAKPEKQISPFDDVSKGDSVRIEYDSWEKRDGGKGYTIYVIENLSRPKGIGPQPSAEDEPFPPDEDFPPDATSEPVEAPLDKDHSIVRQTCIKAAGMALQHNMGNAEEKAGQMTYLAGVLEDWCWR